MGEIIDDIVAEKKLAVVGVSPKKFGGAIYKELKKRGYEVYPVHLTRGSFEGNSCYTRLSELPPGIKAAVVAVSPDSALTVVDDARAVGISHLWFQQGKDFSKAQAEAESAGIKSVAGKCILMYAPPVGGVHKVHRFFVNLFGRL